MGYDFLGLCLLLLDQQDMHQVSCSRRRSWAHCSSVPGTVADSPIPRTPVGVLLADQRRPGPVLVQTLMFRAVPYRLRSSCGYMRALGIAGLPFLQGIQRTAKSHFLGCVPLIGAPSSVNRSNVVKRETLVSWRLNVQGAHTRSVEMPTLERRYVATSLWDLTLEDPPVKTIPTLGLDPDWEALAKGYRHNQMYLVNHELVKQGKKKCRICKEIKVLEDFTPSKRQLLGGVISECKDCALVLLRKSFLLRKYGITQQQYDDMLVAQAYACAICGNLGKSLDSMTRTHARRGMVDGVLVVDHDHTTGVVRGLLCARCNTGIGQFRDDPQVVKLAYEYLLKFTY
jgi:hypothetical protein